MKGFPKSFGTKQDVMNCLQMFPEETKQALSQMLERRFTWVNGAVLDPATEIGLVDENHKVVVNEETGEKVQYERIEDPNCQLFVLGFTVEEAEGLING